MKRILLNCFLFIFLISCTEVHELLKLPLLFHHYLEHHKELTFAQFLNKHYSQEDTQGGKNDEHQKLPFKGNDCNGAQILIHIVPNTMQFCGLAQATGSDIIGYCEQNYPCGKLSCIWQPPKNC